MKHINLFALCLALITIHLSALSQPHNQIIPRDSLSNAIHLNGYGHFYQNRYFQNTPRFNQKITMDLMLFCPESGCSNWDYTIKVFAGKKVNNDTILHELGRIMTPYGGEYNWRNNITKWQQHYFFDVTDYAPILKDSTLIMVRYEGWQDGFMVNVDFRFVPDPQHTTEVIKIIPLYNGYFPYGQIDNPIESFLPSHKIDIPKNADHIYLKTIISGHGADSIQTCSEFCKKYYQIIVNDQVVYKKYIWKEDCGYNWIQPQGGTWIFDRAGWCPGTKTNEHLFDLTDIVKGKKNFDVKIVFEPDTIYQKGQAGYAINADLFILKTNKTKPLAIFDGIIVPNIQYAQYPARHTFDSIKVVIQNIGSETLQTYKLQVNDQLVTFNNKALKFRQKDTLIINNQEFKIKESEELTLSIYTHNKISDTRIIHPLVKINHYPQDIAIEVITNDSAQENHIYLRQIEFPEHNSTIDTIWSPRTLISQKQYSCAHHFNAGKYELIITDSMCDGLSWWFRPEQGEGKIRIIDSRTGELLKVLSPDFGCELRYQFIIDEDFTRNNPEPIFPIPSAAQIDWQKMEKYAFVHFGLNTFNDAEWGYGNTSPELFNPSNLDCEQWVQTFVKSGLSGVIITAKHHDGFCLWPSQYTEYSVKNSPWRAGKGDLIAELSEACKKYGLKMGLYLSPWDRNHAEYGNPEYVQYYHNQWIELLTRYDNIFEIWVDGANGGDGWYGGCNCTRTIDRRNYYEFSSLFDTLHKIRPDLIIFSDGGPGCRWVGNEKGFAGETNWSFLQSQKVYPGYPNFQELTSGHPDGNAWIPAECDVSIRPGWFYHSQEDSLVKNTQQLTDLYYKSVGRNANLLLNFPVNREGKISFLDSASAVNSHQCIRKELRNNILSGKIAVVSNQRDEQFNAEKLTDNQWNSYWATDTDITHGTISFTFDSLTKINRILLQEYIPLGQRVTSFSIEYFDGNRWQSISTEEKMTTIGYKRIIRCKTIEAKQLRINIINSRASICLCNIQAFYTEPKP